MNHYKALNHSIAKKPPLESDRDITILFDFYNEMPKEDLVKYRQLIVEELEKRSEETKEDKMDLVIFSMRLAGMTLRHLRRQERS